MPSIISNLALIVTASLGPTTALASNVLYLGTLTAIYGSVSRSASMIRDTDI